MGERRKDGGQLVNREVQEIRKEEVRATMKKLKSGKVVGKDDIPMEMSG